MGKLICTVLRGLSGSDTTWLPDQLIENKARFIEQFERGDVSVREIDDIGTAVLSAAEIKAIASGNPRIRRKVELDAELLRLVSLRTSFYDTQSQRRSMRWHNQNSRVDLKRRLDLFCALQELLAPSAEQAFSIGIVATFGQADGAKYTKRDAAGEAILTLLDQALQQAKTAFKEAEHAERQHQRPAFGQRASARGTEFDAYWLEPQKVDHVVGQYRGLTLRIKASASERDQWVGCYLTFPFEDQEVAIPDYTVQARTSQGVMSSIDARLRTVHEDIAKTEAALARLKQEDVQLATALAQPWEHEGRFVELSDELDAINAELRIAEQAESAHEAATSIEAEVKPPSEDKSDEATSLAENQAFQAAFEQTLVLNAPDIVMMRVPVLIPEPENREAFAAAFAALVALTNEEAAQDSASLVQALEQREVDVCPEVIPAVQQPQRTLATETVRTVRIAPRPVNTDVPIFGQPIKKNKGVARKTSQAIQVNTSTDEQLDLFGMLAQASFVSTAPPPTSAVQLTMAL